MWPNMSAKSVLVWTVLVVSEMVSTIASKRPFYNIAHMVNSIREVDHYLSQGANALEADVTFSSNGSAIVTYHGYPCDCFRHCTEREEFSKYLAYIRDITTPGNAKYRKSLALLFLDLKVSQLPPSLKALSGQELAAAITDHLYNDRLGSPRVKLLLSVGHVYDYDFILGFENELSNRHSTHLNRIIGWDVGLNDPLFVIESMWKRLGRVKNIWQGDGRTNCLSPFYNLGRLTAAIKRRDETNMMRPEPLFDKVYHWTIDLTVNLRSSLRTGVDGIITNHPERVVNVLKENEFVKAFRLATQDDDPFQRYTSGKYSATDSAINQPLGIRIAHGVGDMFMSFSKYVGDAIYVKAPTLFGFRGRALTDNINAIQQLINMGRDSRGAQGQ